jgi:hypothetical protein
MAGGAPGGHCVPWQCNRFHRLEEIEGAAAFLPCSGATTEKMDGGDGAMAEFGGNNELVRHSGGQERSSTRQLGRGSGAREAR